jgi:hypothetical protein
MDSGVYIQLNENQSKFLRYLLKLQEDQLFNNGRKATLQTIVNLGYYDAEQQKSLKKLVKQYKWWIRQRQLGMNPGYSSHFSIKL